MNSVHFSSERQDWETPHKLFNLLNTELGPFTLDVAASSINAKCSKFFSEEADGLTQIWEGICWMNPPYGREIGKWVKKAYEESLKGCLVVCLLPSRTDTKWFHDYAKKGEIRFLRGRLRFVGAKSSAPFPSMVVIFRPKAL